MFGDLWGDLAVKIIGRIREKDILSSCLSSKRPEFVVVYGRRRVGKTFLIKEFFKTASPDAFSFYLLDLGSVRNC